MPVLSSNVKISLGTIPAPFTGAAAWLALTPLVNTINNNFNVIANGSAIIPGTVRTINSRPVSLTDGNLPLLLTDIPGAASNVYVNSTFATVTNLTNLTNRINANVTAANVAIASLRTTVNSLSGSNVAGNTEQVSGWIQSNAATLTTAWTANAGSQQTQITTLGADIASYKTYANTQIGVLYTSLSTLQSNAGVQAADINTLYSNAAAQATAINSVTAGLASYRTTVNNSLASLTDSVDTLNSQVSTLDDQQISVDSSIGSLSTQVSSLTSQVGTINTNWTGNVASLKSNTATLASQINRVNANVAALSNAITISRTVHVDSRVPTSSEGSFGDIWYQTY
jgi:hypothetical protein